MIINSEGELDVDLVKGVDKFTDKILFLASECNTKIGVGYQKKQMKYFPNTELAVIKGSGHMMFGEQASESIRIVREYLKRYTHR